MSSRVDVGSLLTARRAVLVAFLFHGIAGTSWFVRIPDLRDRAGLSDGGLGLVLAALGVGALASMPLAGTLAARRGSASAVRIALPLLALALALAAQAGSPVALALGSFALGAALGVHDVAMNTQGVTIERELRRPVLSGMHAAFSAGALIGAGVGALAIAAGVSPRVHLTLVAAALLTGLLAYRQLLPTELDREAERPRHVARPPLRARLAPLAHVWLLACAVAATASFVAENSVSEWSGVLLRDHRGASPAFAGTALVVFSIAMMTGRITGDRTVARLGDRRTLVLSGSIAAAAWAVVAVVDDRWVALGAWAVAGFVLANAVPVVFRAAATRRPTSDGQPVPAPAQALAVVSGLGYAGGLIGPALVGGVATVASLPAAMLVPAALAATIALLSGPAVGRGRARDRAEDAAADG